MNASEIQSKIMRIFDQMPSEEIGKMLIEIKSSLSYSTDVAEYLAQCQTVSEMARKKPEILSSVDQVMQLIQYTLFGKKESRLSYMTLFGIKHYEQIKRICDGSSNLSMKQIEEACDRFQTMVKKRYWKNLIISFSPSIPDPGQTDSGVEEAAIRCIWDSLENEQRYRYFSESEWKFFFRQNPQDSPVLKADELYAAIDAAVDRLRPQMSYDKMFEASNGTLSGSWKRWKREWKKSPGAGAGMHRGHIFIIAAILELNVEETRHLMNLAGYRVCFDREPDKVMQMYLLANNPSPENKQKILQYLYQYLGKNQ